MIDWQERKCMLNTSRFSILTGRSRTGTQVA